METENAVLTACLGALGFGILAGLGGRKKITCPPFCLLPRGFPPCLVEMERNRCVTIQAGPANADG